MSDPLRTTLHGKPLSLDDVFAAIKLADERAEIRHEYTRSNLSRQDVDIRQMQDRLTELEAWRDEVEKGLEALEKTDKAHADALEEAVAAMKRLVTETRTEIEDSMKSAHGVNTKILAQAVATEEAVQKLGKDVRAAVSGAVENAIVEKSTAIDDVAKKTTKDPRAAATAFLAGAFLAGVAAAIAQLLSRGAP